MKYVCFSLDCELAWGFADLEPPVERVQTMENDPSTVRDTYSTIIELFDKYEVPATFAFVGHLFFSHCSEGTHYLNNTTGPADPFTDQQRNPLYYGPDLIQMVKKAEINHDIGAHSFLHPVFEEIDRETARSDLKAMTDAADKNGISINSFVYPRNAAAHIDLLDEFGIETYRGKTIGENHILRSGLKPFLMQEKDFWSIPPVRPTKTDAGPVRVDGSRLLHEVRWCYIHPLRLRRSVSHMDDGEILHFCFHPHDLLGYFKLEWILEILLKQISDYREKGIVEVVTMDDVATLA